MSQLDQPAAEMTDVNPLAAAVRFAAIRQQRDPHTHSWETMSGNFLDTCLDYSLTIYVTQRTAPWRQLC